jgi:hypothetical protein
MSNHIKPVHHAPIHSTPAAAVHPTSTHVGQTPGQSGTPGTPTDHKGIGNFRGASFRILPRRAGSAATPKKNGPQKKKNTGSAAAGNAGDDQQEDRNDLSNNDDEARLARLQTASFSHSGREDASGGSSSDADADGRRERKQVQTRLSRIRGAGSAGTTGDIPPGDIHSVSAAVVAALAGRSRETSDATQRMLPDVLKIMHAFDQATIGNKAHGRMRAVLAEVRQALQTQGPSAVAKGDLRHVKEALIEAARIMNRTPAGSDDGSAGNRLLPLIILNSLRARLPSQLKQSSSILSAQIRD